MKRDFDRAVQDLSKQSLKVKGQEFVLDAQLKIMTEQMQKLKAQEAELNESTRKVHSELHQTNKENSRQ